MPPRQRAPEGPPPAPSVQRLRIRYARRGRLRFTSTRDFQRVLERAVRRAQVPVAFSGGFHPHPRISYANAAPTGVASEAEYFELHVTRRVEASWLRDSLDAALPPGLDVLAVVEPPPGALADRLEASDWSVEVCGVPAGELQEAVTGLLAASRHEVTRMTKNGPRTFDVREAIVSMSVEPGEGCEILRMVVRHTTPAVRPDDAITALREMAGLEPQRPPKVTRLAQGPLDPRSGTVSDPLAPAGSPAADMSDAPPGRDEVTGTLDDAAQEREPDSV